MGNELSQQQGATPEEDRSAPNRSGSPDQSLQTRFANFSASNLGREVQQKTREMAEKLKLTKARSENTQEKAAVGNNSAKIGSAAAK